MKLYYNPASYPCRRVVAVADHLDLPLETLLIDFTNPNDAHMKELRSLDVAERMPLLVDGDFKLGESMAIMQYLTSKKIGQTLFPEDAKSRAEIMRWQCFTLAHLGEAAGTFVYENLFKKMFEGSGPDSNAVAEAREEFEDHASVLNTHLKDRTYMIGKNLTLADFAIASPLTYWKQAEIPLEKFEHFYAWYQRMEALPAWKKTEPKF